MTRLLAVDPGSTESAYVIIETETMKPLEFDKIPNEDLMSLFRRGDIVVREPLPRVVIEMVASYGMPVGAEVFETVRWIGRFQQQALTGIGELPGLVTRLPVKLHHCHDSKANDANIKTALVDRFAPGVRNHGKGTKAEPGFFYGFRADVWAAFALAVYAADQHQGGVW